jgi:hypothetical protein
MTMRARTAYIRLSAFVLLSASSAGAARSDALPEEMIREDTRLSKPVTISSPRIFVADLVESLSKQTGVPLSVGSKDGSGDERICVHLQDVPLSDAMNALWSLFSYKKALWAWHRDGGPGAYSYVLVRPPAAQSLAGQLAGYIQEAFEAETEALITLAKMTPEERRRHAGDIRRAMLQEDDTITEAMLASTRLWDGLATFEASTSRPQREKILRGEQSLKVEVSQFSDRGKSWVHSTWEPMRAMRRKSAADPWVPVPVPATVTFYAQSTNHQMSPTLYMEMAGIGGYGYSGATPMDNVLRKRMQERWMLPGDALLHPDSTKALPASNRPVATVPGKWPMARRLLEFGELASISVMARLPIEQRDPTPPNGTTVGAYIERVCQVLPLPQTKSRHRVLLVTYPDWFRDEPHGISWSAYRAVLDMEKQGQGFFTFSDMAKAASRFTPKQLADLSDDFPVMANVSGLRAFFVAAQTEAGGVARIQSDRGMRLTQQTLDAIKSAGGNGAAWLAANRVVAVRVRQTETTWEGRAEREITFDMKDEAGKWIPYTGFRYQPRTSP